jgi:hypothetical protein
MRTSLRISRTKYQNGSSTWHSDPSLMLALPSDVLILILAHLDIDQLVAVSETCTALHSLVSRLSSLCPTRTGKSQPTGLQLWLGNLSAREPPSVVQSLQVQGTMVAETSSTLQYVNRPCLVPHLFRRPPALQSVEGQNPTSPRHQPFPARRRRRTHHLLLQIHFGPTGG